MKKALSLVLFAAMLISLFAFNINAAWDGTSVSASLKGEGTADSPYIVETAEDLAYLAKSVNEGTTYEGKYIVQTADIDLGGKEWTPIGTSAHPFSGVYNGYGKSVSGLSITQKIAASGLFGYVASGATCSAGIANLNVSGSITLTESNASDGIGGLSGWFYKDSTTLANPITVTNCNVDVDITISNDTKECRVGGVAGYAFCTVFENVVNNGDVYSNSNAPSRVGGIIGQGNRDTFVNCVNNGKITSIVNDNANKDKGKHISVAGFVGMLTAKVNGEYTTFTNCVNNGDVTGHSTLTNSSNASVGGFIGGTYTPSGINGMYLKIEKCLNTGKITSKVDSSVNTYYPYAGGMISYINKAHCAVIDCVGAGEIVSEGGAGSRAGGINGVMHKENEATLYAQNCSTTAAKINGYTKNNGQEGCQVGLAADVIAPMANAITSAITSSQSNIAGFPTASDSIPEEAPETTEPAPETTEPAPETTEPAPETTEPGSSTPTGDSALIFVAIAIISLIGVAVIAKRREN